MPPRGRGAPGGRGGTSIHHRSTRGKARIGGQEMSWDYDPSIYAPSSPQENFPPMGEDFPLASPPTLRELKAMRFFEATRNRIHNGPLHTILGDRVRVGKHGGMAKKAFNPFEDFPAYSDKYKEPVRKLPDFGTRAYPVRFFPEELRDILEPSRARANGLRMPKRPKARPKQATNHDGDDDEAFEDEEQQQQQDEEDEERPAKRKADEDEEEEPEEADPDPDETYEDDEDEMAGDYNAEQYFDGGEGDGEDGDLGGDDGDADFD